MKKEKATKAVREIPVLLKTEKSYGSQITIDLETKFDEDDMPALTDKQIDDLAKQIVEKINGMKVTLLAAIICPNCGKKLDESDTKGKFHCPDCNVNVKMEFLE